MSSSMGDTVSTVEIPPIHISLDGNKVVPCLVRILPEVEKIITVIISRDGITKVTETLRKYGDRFDYLILGHAGNVKNWKLLKSTISAIGFEIVDLGIDEDVINILLKRTVKKVFSRHSYGFAKNAGPSDASSGRSSRGSGCGRTPTPSGRRLAGIQVPATKATRKGTGGIENVDTQKRDEIVAEKPTAMVYSSQRSREIKHWMARILGGKAEDTREEPVPVEVVVDSSRTKAKFTAEAIEEWLEGALAATAGVACPSMGKPDQKLWFGKDPHSLKRKSEMIGNTAKAAISPIENLVASRFRKKIKIAKVGEMGEIKPTARNNKIEVEKPTIEENITIQMNIPQIPAIEIIDNTPPIETQASPLIETQAPSPPTVPRKIVKTKMDGNQLPIFTTKSSRVFDNNVLSPIMKTEVRVGTSRSYLPTIRSKNTPTTEKNMSPTFATKSSNIFDKNVLSPTTLLATKSSNNMSTIHAKGKARAHYGPTIPPRKFSTPIKNVLTPAAEKMATPVIAGSPTTPTTKSSTHINSVSTPAVKKMVTPVIEDPSKQSIRDKISSKIPMKHIPTTAKNTRSVQNNIVTPTAENESIPILRQSISGKASSNIAMTRRPFANKINTTINKILTPNLENKAGPISGVKYTPIKAKPKVDVTSNAPIEDEVKKNRSTPTVRKAIPAPAVSIRVSPRKYKSTVRETTTPPVENVFTPIPKKKVTSSVRKQSTPTVSYATTIVSPMTATKVIPTTRKNSFPAVDKKIKNEKVIPMTETSPPKSTKSPTIGGMKTQPLKLTPSLYPRRGRCLRAAKEPVSTLTTEKRPVEIRPVRRLLFLD